LFCNKCGKENPDNAFYCGACGAKVVAVREQQTVVKEDLVNSRVDKGPGKLEYAGFWIRLGAFVIDVLGMVGGAVVIGYVLGYLFGEGVSERPEIFWNYSSYALYGTFTLTIWSTTFGKYMYGLKVLTKDNKNLSFGLSLKRSLLQPLSTLFFGVGYWNMGKNDKKQAWHDIKTGTVVVREERGLVLAYVVTVIAAIIWIYLYSLGA